MTPEPALRRIPAVAASCPVGGWTVAEWADAVGLGAEGVAEALRCYEATGDVEETAGAWRWKEG